MDEPLAGVAHSVSTEGTSPESDYVAGWHAVKLLGRLRAAGFTIRAEGDRLIVAPRDRLTSADVAVITERRIALLAVLTGTSPWVDPQSLSDVDRAIVRQVAIGAWNGGPINYNWQFAFLRSKPCQPKSPNCN